MKTYKSEVKEIGLVSFPEFKGEKVYMVPFLQKEGLPLHLKRWQNTVDQMLKGISTELPIYLMIDEAFVPGGKEQRRPGLHIDGYWLPEQNTHGSGHGSKSSLMGKHGSHGGHKSNKKEKGSWETADFDFPEGLILASNISASRGFIGDFKGPIKDMGDCGHISTNGLTEVNLEANKAYMGNVTFLHESLPVKTDCYRTLVRLNVPGIKL
jgi:hypothetical protein